VASKGTSGWESLGGNDPTKYRATLDYDNGTVGSNGKQNKSKISVITNRSNGSYDVYKKTLFGDKLIYQYNASTNEPNIVNKTDFQNFFVGVNAQQYTNLTSDVKQATLTLAKENLSGSTSRKEYQELQQTPGYRSLSNTEEPPATDDTDGNGTPLSGGEEQGSGSSAVDNGVFTGGDSTGFLAPDGFSSGSNFSFTNFKSLGSDAFLGTADDITAAGDSFAFGAENPGLVQNLSAKSTKLDSKDPFYTRKFGEDGERLTYPEADLTSFGYDYIQITGHKYTTKNSSGFNGGELNLGSVSEKLGQITKIVQLPMQPNLSESSAVDWTQDEINEIQRRAAGIAGNAINGIRGSATLDNLGKVFANLMGNTGRAAKELINDPGLGPFITAYFAGQAVGANVVARTTGQVLNKNLELLFKGPKLRQFSFNFTFTPRSDSEAVTIRKMIRFFKKSMAPEISPERIFLYTPDIFELQYIHNSGGGHPYLNRFKPCALTNFSANYTPGNSYMTYKDGSMTQYQVTMTFSELEPIYQKDHDGVGGTGY
jgi:hypothetical protein